MTVVLDASAIIAVIKNEPGAELVLTRLRRRRWFRRSTITEVVTWLVGNETLRTRRGPPYHRDFARGASLSMTRGRSRRDCSSAKTRHRGLSLADRACLALAIELGLPVHDRRPRLARSRSRHRNSPHSLSAIALAASMHRRGILRAAYRPKRLATMAQVIEANGARIPLVGLGTWDLRGKTCARMVEEAIGLGYRHIDTAAMYGNEAAVGEGAARLRRAARRGLHHHQGLVERSARRAISSARPATAWPSSSCRASICC